MARLRRVDVWRAVGTRIRRLSAPALALALASACGRSGYDPLDAGGPPGDPLDAARPPRAVCDVADPRLEACYAFETDGRDGSTHGHDLVLDSTTFVAGPRGMALSRAALSRVAAPSLTALHGSGLTIDLWARVDRVPTTGRAGLADKEGQFGVFVHPGGELRCTAGGAAVACGGLEEGAWRHVGCTFDGTGLRLYLDGVRCDETLAAGSIPAGDSALHLGENSPDGADALVGAIDSVRLWSAALTPDEICAAAGC